MDILMDTAIDTTIDTAIDTAIDTTMHDEAALVARAQQGDPTALAEIVTAHQQTVYQVALRMCGNPQDAEETLQETFLSAITALPRFEQRARLSTWLYRIASNACLMRRRAAANHPEVALHEASDPTPADAAAFGEEGHTAPAHPRYFVDWSGLPESALLNAELHTVLEEAIAALPPDLRIVLIWRDLEGLSTAETAEAVGITQANVKVRLHRARLALRATLAAYFQEQTAS
jgi:RNA polymerase sigma-70 factor (ECF subfamily)